MTAAQSEIELIKEFYLALNQNNVKAALILFHPNALRVEFEDLPNGGTYRGHEELSVHISQGRSTWAEGGCFPGEFFISEDKIVVDVHVKVRQKDKTEWIDAHVADGFILQNGKITEMRSFLKKQQAFDWAGIKN